MSTETKVVSLHGEALPTPGEPVADVVKLLDEVLERARSGETLGVVVVERHADESASSDRAGSIRYMNVLGVLEYEKYHLL
jgi:hypothetical protein